MANPTRTTTLAERISKSAAHVVEEVPSFGHFEPYASRDELVAKIIEEAVYNCVRADSSTNILSLPFVGAITAFPMALVTCRFHMQMVRNIALVGGRRIQNPAILLSVMAAALGGAKRARALRQNEGLLLTMWAGSLQAASLQVANAVAPRLLFGMVPVAGPLMLDMWIRYSTQKLGRFAAMVFIGEDAGEQDVRALGTASPGGMQSVAASELSAAGWCKLQLLAGMARVDGSITLPEQLMLDTWLNGQQISEQQRALLTQILKGRDEPMPNMQVLANCPDGAVALLTNMALLAWADGRLHPGERLYLRRIGQLLGFSASDIDELMDSCDPRHEIGGGPLRQPELSLG
jgi:hypothetical protein